MQRKDKVSRLPLRWRLRVAEALMAGDSYQEIRVILRGLGATDTQLPSDHSFNVFKDTEEFLNLMEQEIERYQLERRAATAEAMMDCMATVALGNALKRLDWALADDELSHRELLDTLRGMTQFHALKLATVRERRMWGDTEGEPPAIFRTMAGAAPAGTGVPVPYGEMRAPVYPEVPLAESLLDLDALTDRDRALAAEAARAEAEREAELAAGNAKETEAERSNPKETELARSNAKEAEAEAAEAEAAEEVEAESDAGVSGVAMAVASARASAAESVSEPATGVDAVTPGDAKDSEAVAGKAKETEVAGSKPTQSEVGGGEPPSPSPSPEPEPERAKVRAAIITPPPRTHIVMPATAPYVPPADAAYARRRSPDDDDHVGVGMRVRMVGWGG